jgi:hypothetical protein
MRTLHDYVAKQLADKLKSRRVVVWYDERGEFQPFVDEVRGGPRAVSEPGPVAVAGAKASLAEFAGSMFELRAVVEPHVSGDTPDSVVVYVPGIARDRRASVLMELEKAGTTWEPQLKQLAKNVLLQKYTLGVVDEMLPFDRKVSYEDLARAAAGNSGSEPPSILKSIFHDASGNDWLLTAWLVSNARDGEIVSKEATRELTKLVKARLGLDLACRDCALLATDPLRVRVDPVGGERSRGRPPALEGLHHLCVGGRVAFAVDAQVPLAETLLLPTKAVARSAPSKRHDFGWKETTPRSASEISTMRASRRPRVADGWSVALDSVIVAVVAPLRSSSAGASNASDAFCQSSRRRSALAWVMSR